MILKKLESSKKERIKRIVPEIINDKHRLYKYNITGTRKEIKRDVFHVLDNIPFSDLLEIEYNIFGKIC